MSDIVDCTGLNPGDVLAQLYNKAIPIGMGFYQAKAVPMAADEANNLLKSSSYFDYLHGRPLKLSFEKFPTLNVRLYDRDQGTGAAQKAIDELRKTNTVTNDVLFESKTKEELKQIIEDSKIHITHIPRGKCLKDLKLEKFNTVFFEDHFCKILEKSGVPYPNEWHVFMGILPNGEYDFVGSVGGRFSVRPDHPCVNRVSHDMGI